MRVSKSFIEFGYKAAIILAFLGIILSSAYLFTYLRKSNPKEITQMETMVAYNAERKMVLLSTGVFVAMSFGFLGFSLFLLEIKGKTDVAVSTGNYMVNLSQLSPGLFIFLCSTVIIIFSVTHNINYNVVVSPEGVKNSGFIDDSKAPEDLFHDQVKPARDSAQKPPDTTTRKP